MDAFALSLSRIVTGAYRSEPVVYVSLRERLEASDRTLPFLGGFSGAVMGPSSIELCLLVVDA